MYAAIEYLVNISSGLYAERLTKIFHKVVYRCICGEVAPLVIGERACQ